MPSDKQDKAAKPSARRWTKTLTLFASIGWLAAGLLAADKINAQNMTSSLHNALVRSQTERHILSQELQRMTGEVDALQERLSRYRERETAQETP